MASLIRANIAIPITSKAPMPVGTAAATAAAAAPPKEPTRATTPEINTTKNGLIDHFNNIVAIP